MVVESPSGGLLPVMPDATDTTNNMLAISGPCGIKCIVKPFSDMLFQNIFSTRSTSGFVFIMISSFSINVPMLWSEESLMISSIPVRYKTAALGGGASSL